MNNTNSVLGVSDISVGYGSPQVPQLIRLIARHYGQVKGTLIEPDQSERRASTAWNDLQLHRVRTRYPMFEAAGLIEYAGRVVDMLNTLQPSIVVISSPFLLSVLPRLKYRPRFVIYYMLESMTYYAEQASTFWRLAVDLARHCTSKVDLIISPEENRASRDVELCNLQSTPMVVVYNVNNFASQVTNSLPPLERDARMLYSGTIQKRLTYAEYFLNPALGDIPIDMYGLIEGEDKDELHREFLATSNDVRYLGYIDNQELAQVRKRYAYSLILWRPDTVHRYYACPNKFFEAIADGVPPITAPHPQCEMLVERYDCGIVMRNWSFEAFSEALYEGMRLLGTARYQRLVENCRLAVANELSWDSQFEKVRYRLPEVVN